jgi:hypothetical protein
MMACKWIALWMGVICFGSHATAQKVLRPFPRHVKYFNGTIKPNPVSQAEMDKQVCDFYRQWKAKFVKSIPKKSESYIWFQNIGNKQCVSEGQGYGMTIVAIMAGYDASAQVTYDNLFH